MNEEPDLPAAVYWTVAACAVLVMALLGWLTAAFGTALGGAG